MIWPILEDWYNKQEFIQSTGDGGGVRHHNPLSTLAARSGIGETTLWNIFEGRTKTVDFDIAERIIISATGMAMINFFAEYPELEKWYYKVDLSTKDWRIQFKEDPRCGRTGCMNTFKPNMKGGTVRKYCSHACSAAASRKNRGKTRKTEGGPGDKLRRLRCKNGHERTETNTTRDINGKVVCLDCKRNRTREYKERKIAKEKAQRQVRTTRREEGEERAIAGAA